MKRPAPSVLLSSLLVGLVSGCASLLGADFDRPRELGEGRSSPGSGDGGADAVGVVEVPAPEPVKPDGTCAEGRKVCGGQCVSTKDARYGCAGMSCDPCGTGTCTPAGSCGTDAGSSKSACAAALAALLFDFNDGPRGWTHGVLDGVTVPASYPYDAWGHGVPSVGADCPSGTCFAAPLDRNYAQCSRGFVQSPTMDLSDCVGQVVVLSFRQTYAFWSAKDPAGVSWFDGGILQVSGDGGSSWRVPPANYPGAVKIRKWVGTPPEEYGCLSSQFTVDDQPGFVQKQLVASRFEVRLPASVVTDATRIRFAVGSGQVVASSDVDTSRAATDFGWRIDDITFELH